MQFFGYFTLWQISTTVQAHIFLESVMTLANFEFLADVFIQELRVECDDFGDVGEVSCETYTVATGFKRLPTE
jgi:hypothetical protein